MRLVETLPVTVAEIDMLESLAVVAVEHEGSLDILGFTQLIDLYAHYAMTPDGSDAATRVPFERFVRDAVRLGMAAEAAERASGLVVRAPLPLP